MPKYKLVRFMSESKLYPELSKMGKEGIISSIDRIEGNQDLTENEKSYAIFGIRLALQSLGYQIVEEDEAENDPAPAATEAEFTTEVGESKFSVSKDEIEVIGKNIQITGLKTPGDIS